MANLSPVKMMRSLAMNTRHCSSSLPFMESLSNKTNAIGTSDIAQRPSFLSPIAPKPISVKRQVSFGKIQISEFSPAIGDQPFVSNGVPIALSNNMVREIKDVPVDTFERLRQPARKRNSKQLVIKPDVRAELLLSEGYARNEINEAALSVFNAKKHIQKSARGKHWDGVNEKFETTSHFLHNIIPLRRPRRSSSGKFTEGN